MESASPSCQVNGLCSFVLFTPDCGVVDKRSGTRFLAVFAVLALVNHALPLCRCHSESGADLFEFPVNRTSECSRIGKKGYLFEFDYEALLFTFQSDAGEFIDASVSLLYSSLSPLTVATVVFCVCRFSNLPQHYWESENGQRFVGVY